MDLIEAQSTPEEPRRRRRGADLESAILDAAWAQLSEQGYTNFTVESVAARAGTSRPVVYRRWPTKEDLVLAAVSHGGRHIVSSVPDTGTLRGDVLAVLNGLNATRADFSVMLVAHFGLLYSQTDLTPADLRARYLSSKTIRPLSAVVERAVQRGEVDPSRVTERILAVPLDLVRHGLMMRLDSLPQSEIDEIVDQVFLPLLGVNPDASGTPKPGAAAD